jgi:hypothetical protein
MKLMTAALVAGLIASSAASAETVRVTDGSGVRTSSFVAGARPKASVKLLACRSSAYYQGRSVKFRVRMHRFSDTNAAQRMEMRLSVLRRLNEGKKFKRIVAPGLDQWQASKDSATIYQRDLMLAGVEPAAAYKARVSLRWMDSAGGKIEFRRTITSKPCVQKRSTPRLTITAASAVPSVGTKDFEHTITVKNLRPSEALSVPVAIYIDELDPVITTVDSIGPRQSVDVHLVAPSCAANGYAVIDPLRSLVRLPKTTQLQFPLPRCR